MKDIVLIESILVNDPGIVITAIVEDMQYVPGSQTLIDPPEYAPARCTITVPFDDIPDHIDVFSLDEDGLEETINKYVNIDLYDWKVVAPDNSNDDPSEDRRYSRCFF